MSALLFLTIVTINNRITTNIKSANAFISTPSIHPIHKQNHNNRLPIKHKTIPKNSIIYESTSNNDKRTVSSNEKVIEFLKRENQLLKHEIQLLQDTNKMLRTNANVIIETFEGERNIPKWFKEDEEDMDFKLQQDDDETDEYWNNTIGSGMSGEEECIIPDTNGSIFNIEECPIEPDVSFQSALRDRAIWLVGLLLLQSFSGIILSRNEELIQQHPFIVYFLTMLVGAGGNAGNQASVRVIRGLALGTLNEATQNQFLSREIKMAFGLSGILSIAGFVRAFLFKTPIHETFAITCALCCIVLSSICLGAVLPLILKKLGVDPAHSSTSIQVIMDVLGVFITVLVCTFILDGPLGQFAISKLSL